jgi:hypothetical protein
MERLDRIPLRHPQVLWRAIEDETLIVNLDTRRVSVLNRVGGEVWALMDGTRQLGEIVEEVGVVYGVVPERVQDDVESFVQALVERDMLSWA